MKRAVQFFDAVAEEYGERWTIEEESRLVAARLAAGLVVPVLEVGCGNGRLLCNLTDSVGLDFSEEMLRFAHKRAPNAILVRGTAERLPFRRGAIGTALAVNVIHNHPSPIPAIAALADLGPDLLITDFRNRFNPVVAWREWKTRHNRTLKYRPTSRRAWAKILAAHGYRVERVVPVRRPLSDPGTGFRLRHLLGSIISLLPGLAPCYVVSARRA